MFNVPLGVIRCAVKNYQLSPNWSENYYLFNALNLSLFVYVTLTDRKIKYFFLNYHKLLKVTFPFSETTKIHKTPPCGHLPYCKADVELCYPLCPSGSGLRCPTAPLNVKQKSHVDLYTNIPQKHKVLKPSTYPELPLGPSLQPSSAACDLIGRHHPRPRRVTEEAGRSPRDPRRLQHEEEFCGRRHSGLSDSFGFRVLQ